MRYEPAECGIRLTGLKGFEPFPQNDGQSGRIEFWDRGTFPLHAGPVGPGPFPFLIRGGERLQNLVASEEWGRSPAFALQRPSKAAGL